MVDVLQDGLFYLEMAKQIRPMHDAIDRVRQVLERGKYKIEFNIPMIVVIGDQSSGKSSLMERISQVQLPKGGGMVTRCPLEI